MADVIHRSRNVTILDLIIVTALIAIGFALSGAYFLRMDQVRMNSCVLKARARIVGPRGKLPFVA